MYSVGECSMRPVLKHLQPDFLNRICGILWAVTDCGKLSGIVCELDCSCCSVCILGLLRESSYVLSS
jgi:hypothetical protein